MKIIKSTTNPSGAFPPFQEWRSSNIPDGYTSIADDVDTSVFYAYNGFVTLEVEGGVVTGFTPNIEAWEAWKAGQVEPPEPLIPLDNEELAEALNILLGGRDDELDDIISREGA